MKKLITILIILSFASPVRAGLIHEFDPVEQDLIQKKQLEDDMGREFKKQPVKPLKSEPVKEEEKSSSNWWKWTLGVVVVGGVAAAAASKGGGGGSPSSNGSSNGSTTLTW